MIIMLILNSVSGNAYNDMKLKEKVHQAEEQKNLQRLLLTRAEMEKSRLRKQTSNGLDIGVSLNPGTTLKDGDVLADNGNFIIVHQLPEKVLHVRIIDDRNSAIFIQVGHIVGNRHRPISISQDNSIIFPIHNEDEVDLFRQLFHDIIDHLELHVDEKIFTPNQGMNVHEH